MAILDNFSVILWLLLFAFGFALAGFLYSIKTKETLASYVIARNSQSTIATVMTLLASSLGAWILFAPAQAASWGGLGAIIGYAIGAMSPRLLMIPLGTRMREIIPKGHTLSEYVMARYGRGMYALTLLIIIFYLFIALTAEITAISKLISLIAPVPLWLTASVVLTATILYTFFGGLQASIFTDKIQIIIIIPLLIALCVFGWQATNGIKPVIANLQKTAPILLDLTAPQGIKAGLTFFIAMLLTGLFHQGTWQRIYSANSTKSLRYGFLLAGVLVAPVIFIMGLFGLAFVGLQAGEDSSVALFSVLMPNLPLVFVILLIPLGLALVMSSADTAINAFSSLVAVDMRRLLPNATTKTLLLLARFLIIPLSLVVWFVASKGYSVLYLFLLADLFCSAAAFPVFVGLFSKRYTSKMAIISTTLGLISGLTLFPAPEQPLTYLMESFLLAAVVPVIASAVLLIILPKKQSYDLSNMNNLVSKID